MRAAERTAAGASERPAATESHGGAAGPPRPAVFSLRRLAWQWAPPLLWMAMILAASSDWLGAQQTESWLRRILAALFGPVAAAKLHSLHLLARKAGHLVAYAILSCLSYRSALGPRPAMPGWSLRAALYALGFSFVTAALDELHQLLTRTRSGSVSDVALDMAGALVALGWICMADRRKTRARAKN